MDINGKKNLVHDIGKLEENEMKEIFKIIRKHKCKFTENENGVFINITNIGDNVLNDMYKCVEYYKANKLNLREDFKEAKPINQECEPDEVEQQEDDIDTNEPNDDEIEDDTDNITEGAQNETAQYTDESATVSIMKKNKPKFTGLKGRLIKQCKQRPSSSSFSSSPNWSVAESGCDNMDINKETDDFGGEEVILSDCEDSLINE